MKNIEGLSKTEIIEQLCNVTVHGLDRINERFENKVTELILCIVNHIHKIQARKLTGPSINTMEGVSTVIECLDDRVTLVTAYLNTKSVKGSGDHQRKKVIKTGKRDKNNKYWSEDD